MGLLDRVKQNQTGVPAPAAPTTNGPVATAPYAAATAIPLARPSAPVETPPSAPSLSSRAASAADGEMSPPFTAAKAQIHAKLIEKFADHTDSTNKADFREKSLERP